MGELIEETKFLFDLVGHFVLFVELLKLLNFLFLSLTQEVELLQSILEDKNIPYRLNFLHLLLEGLVLFAELFHFLHELGPFKFHHKFLLSEVHIRLFANFKLLCQVLNFLLCLFLLLMGV